MSDRFYMSGLSDGWFTNAFEDYHLFGYVGDRDRLAAELARKSLGRRLLEIFGSRLSVAALFNSLASFNLLNVDPERTVAREIINLVTERENQRTLTELLASKYKEGKKRGRYFERVAKHEYQKNSLFEASFNEIQNHLVTVEGQLLHRSAVAQYSPTAAAPLRESEGEWLLSDFPPHALVDRNSDFEGKFLLLTEDAGFTGTFSEYLPFYRTIGWYPYVRLTGFFDASRLQTEILPSLSITLVEYRRPRLFKEVRDSIVAFATDELRRKPIYLDRWSDLILFSYLPPLLFKGSNLEPGDVDAEFAGLLREYLAKCEKDLPSDLTSFYAALPVPAA